MELYKSKYSDKKSRNTRRDDGTYRSFRNSRYSGDDRRKESATVTCADCGTECTVPFVPRTDRPVYCSDCFRQNKPDSKNDGYSRDDGRSRNSRDDGRSRNSRDDGRSRYSRDDKNPRYSRDDKNPRYSRDDKNPRYSRDDKNPRYSRDDKNPRYSRDDKNPRYSRDDKNPRYSRDDKNPRYSRDDKNPRYSRDDKNPRYSRDDKNPRYSRDDKNPRYSRDDGRSRNSRDDSRPRRSSNDKFLKKRQSFFSDGSEKFYASLKEKLFEILGGKICSNCGFKDEKALGFSHKYDVEAFDNIRRGGAASSWGKYISEPELAKKELDVLCLNCNEIRQPISKPREDRPKSKPNKNRRFPR